MLQKTSLTNFRPAAGWQVIAGCKFLYLQFPFWTRMRDLLAKSKQSDIVAFLVFLAILQINNLRAINVLSSSDPPGSTISTHLITY
jgi:hypothetical protein